MKEYTCEKCENLNKRLGAEDALCDNCWDKRFEDYLIENYRYDYYREQKKQS